MNKTVHYVGMSEARYQAARRVFGGPAYYHKYMDARVDSDVGPDDVVIIGDPKMYKYVWDASAVDKRYTE